MHIIVFLLFGLAVGAIARWLVPGTEPGGWGVSLILGISGSFLGTWLGRVLGLYQNGQAAGWIMSLLGAVVLVGVYHAFMRHRLSHV